MMASWPSNTASMTPFGRSIAVEAGTSRLSSVIGIGSLSHFWRRVDKARNKELYQNQSWSKGLRIKDRGSRSPVSFYVSEG
jgi:hypothetical protein